MKMGKGRKGFTLIELLVAIAVIGILISMLIPAVNRVMENARRIKGANCLKQIATAYAQYMNDDVNGRNIDVGDAGTGKDWAIVLAQGKYLNDPNLYIFSGDSGASKVVKKAIVDENLADNDAWEGGDNIEFSIYLVNNVPIDSPLSTTPIAFTRGIPTVSNDPLKTNAKWPWGNSDSTQNGVYGNDGGYIAFLDGHVEWFEHLGSSTSGRLMAWGGNGVTNLIEETLPSTASILSASGKVNVTCGPQSGDDQ